VDFLKEMTFRVGKNSILKDIVLWMTPTFMNNVNSCKCTTYLLVTLSRMLQRCLVGEKAIKNLRKRERVHFRI